MKVSEFIKWAEKNKMLDTEMYVDGKDGYEKVTAVWESEKDGSSVMIETAKK